MFSQKKIHLYGHVTDFNNKPIGNVSIKLKQNLNFLESKNNIFENSYETLTNSEGFFLLEIDEGMYYCLYAIKDADYGVSKLEYWAWNIPIYHDLEINPQYDRIEIYGINGFEPQFGPFNTYKIYFRPMSLTKIQNLKNNTKNSNILDIAPNVINGDEISVFVNGVSAKVVVVDKVREYTRDGHYMFAYMIQIIKPDLSSSQYCKDEFVDGFDKITIILHSKDTKEYGKGEYFLKKVGN